MAGRLSYPGGVRPGFDPSHIAARTTRYSGVAHDKTFTNLLTGKAATPSGTNNGGIDKIIGPYFQVQGFTGTTTTPCPAGTETEGTVAAIWQSNSAAATNDLIGSTTGGLLLSGTSGGKLQLTLVDLVVKTSSFSYAANTPYFAAATTFGTVGGFLLLKNLITGAVVWESISGTSPNNMSGTIQVNPGNSSGCSLAAAMYSGKTLGLMELLSWAADPWSFWYPQRARTQGRSTVNAYTLTAAAGSYTFTGTAATLLHKYIISASAGAYTLTGTDATLRRNLPLVAGAGSYTLTGTAASLLHKYVLTAGAGSYVFTGTDATLTYLSGKTVGAGAGSYTLTGTAASLLHKYIVPASAGSYTFTGSDAILVKGAARTGGGWDTSDPVFYDWWRKRAKEERQKLEAIKAAPARAARAAKVAKPALREETIEAIEVAQSIDEIQAIDMLRSERAVLKKIIAEYQDVLDEEEALLLALIH